MTVSRRDLPGYYWDNDKKRYFPVSFKPPAKPSYSEQQSADGERRQATTFSCDTKSLHNLSKRRQYQLNIKNVECAQRSKGARQQRVPLETGGSAYISAISVSPTNITDKVIGDSQGWIYSTRGNPSPNCFSTELNLTSRITAIGRSGDAFLSGSFGPHPKLFYQSGRDSTTSFVINPGRGVQDLRKLQFDGIGCSIGCKSSAVHLPSIEHPLPTVFSTTSHVLALRQDKHLLYAGARNGSIARIDLRAPATLPPLDLLQQYHSTIRSAVVHIDVLHEWQLLVAGTNNQLDLFDLRFVKKSAKPFLNYPGYVNEYRDDLPVVHDVVTNTIIASMQDCRLRCWDVDSGIPMRCATSSDEQDLPVFKRVFPEPVRALQCAASPTGNRRGLLFIAVGRAIEIQTIMGGSIEDCCID